MRNASKLVRARSKGKDLKKKVPKGATRKEIRSSVGDKKGERKKFLV